jgi:hypothetical protein
MNRIAQAIALKKNELAERIANGIVTQAKVDETHKALDMELDEYVKFQELKSHASIAGPLTLEEANLIYHYLGNTPDHFNKQPIEVKVVLTQVFLELVKRRIRAA